MQAVDAVVLNLRIVGVTMIFLAAGSSGMANVSRL